MIGDAFLDPVRSKLKGAIGSSVVVSELHATIHGRDEIILQMFSNQKLKVPAYLTILQQSTARSYHALRYSCAFATNFSKLHRKHGMRTIAGIKDQDNVQWLVVIIEKALALIGGWR